MKTNINKKKISFLANRKFLKYSFIAIILCLFFVYIYYELIKKDKFFTIIQDISKKNNYQLKNIEINSLTMLSNLILLNAACSGSKDIFVIPG